MVTRENGVQASIEPELALDQIQGIVVPGFFKPHQTLLCVRLTQQAIDRREIHGYLAALVDRISTGSQALDDRRHFREFRKRAEAKPLLAVAFSYRGLRKLTPQAECMRSEAFRLGLAARAALLGDPGAEAETPEKADDCAPPDFMLVVAGDGRDRVNALALQETALLEGIGLAVCPQDGDKLPGHKASHEHFGFVDGISQPGIRGHVPGQPTDFVTKRRVAAHELPAADLYGYPGQDLVWPGEFVLGYAKSGPDPLRPGPIATPEAPWMENGSYLVYNRVRQDVHLFWRTMRSEAARIARLPGFAGLKDVDLAARLMGRHLDGKPLSRTRGDATCGSTSLADDPLVNNHFRFDTDTPRLALVDGKDPYPRATADPLGMVCPLASHIRKVNPRDCASDMGGASGTTQHRVLRVGVPFGEKCTDLSSDPPADDRERGLLFLGIMASIEEQFEFLQARWMNDDRRPRAPSGHDLVAGRCPAGGDRERRCVIFGTEGQAAEVIAPRPFVTSTGGEYFFVPSLDALRTVLAGAREADAGPDVPVSNTP